jgi:hypothetical protein
MKRIKACHSLAWLLALPMMMWSLAGQATNYNIGFGPLEQSNTEKMVKSPDGTGLTLWTYVKNGSVENLNYSQNANELNFYMPASSNAVNSLSLTTFKTFSGMLKGITVSCSEASGLTIKAYVGQQELGELTYNQKIGYVSSNLSHAVLSQPVTLEFIASSQAANGVNVSLKNVSIDVDESVAPLEDDKPVTFAASELSGKDLSKYSYQGVLFTLNKENGDGFEAEDNGIYIGSVQTDAAVAEIVSNYSPGDPGYAIDFAGGITLLVPKGKGYISIEAQNESTHAFHVKIGGAAPVEVSSLERDWLKVPYDVEDDTYIYIYMVQKASGTRIGRRATAHGVIYKVKCASAPTLVPGDANGSGGVDKDDVQMIADYILGKNPAGFKKAQANVDGEGDVTVVDLVKVIGIILSQTP